MRRHSYLLGGTLLGMIAGFLFSPAVTHYPGEGALAPLWWTIGGTIVGLFFDLDRSINPPTAPREPEKDDPRSP